MSRPKTSKPRNMLFGGAISKAPGPTEALTPGSGRTSVDQKKAGVYGQRRRMEGHGRYGHSLSAREPRRSLKSRRSR